MFKKNHHEEAIIVCYLLNVAGRERESRLGTFCKQRPESQSEKPSNSQPHHRSKNTIKTQFSLLFIICVLCVYSLCIFYLLSLCIFPLYLLTKQYENETRGCQESIGI